MKQLTPITSQQPMSWLWNALGSLALGALLATTSMAQTVQVGSGTTMDFTLPINSCSELSYSQQIYTKAQINKAGSISKIRFYYVSGAYGNSNYWRILVGHTTKTSFTSNADWVPLANLTEVYNSTVIYPDAGNWLEVTLTTPFTYNNTDNLVIAVDENHIGYDCYEYWRNFTSGSNTGIYFRSDAIDPDPASPPVATARTSNLAQVQLYFTQNYCAGTPPPGSITSPVNVCNGDLVTLSPTGLTSDYNIAYQWQEFSEGSSSWINIPGATNADHTATLSPGTHQLRIRTTCTTYSVSNYSNTVTVIVGAGTINENFNSGDLTSNCWKTSGMAATDLEYNAASAFGVGTGSVRYNFSSASLGQTLIYTSPVVPAIGAGQNLSFDVAGATSGAGTMDRITLESSSDGGATWSAVQVMTNAPGGWMNTGGTNSGQFAPTSTEWANLSFGLPAGTNRVRFNGVSGSGNACYIDNITLVAASSCTAPTAVTATNVSASGATFTWTASSTNPPNGYQWQVREGGAGGSGSLTVSGTTMAGVTNASTSALAANTTYTLYVRGDCAGGDFSAWAASSSFFTGYCSSNFTSGTYYEYVSNVNFAGISNSSIGISGGPSDYTSQIATVTPGSVSTLSVTISAAPYEFVYGYAFIDWNQNLILDDAGEVYTFVTSSNATGTYTLDITIPTGAAPGNTRMRVMVAPFSGIPAPCQNASYGEAEDYTVHVNLPPDCYAPVATTTIQQDCGNGRFFIGVNLASLGDAADVEIMSDYAGNPGGATAVSTLGQTVLGPFASLSTVNITVVHNGNSTCDLVLAPVTFDCSIIGKNALSFDGGDDNVDCGNAQSVNITGNAITLETWIYPTSWRSNYWSGSIIDKEGPGSGYMLRCGNNGQLSFNLGTGAPVNPWREVLTNTGALTLNIWQHVAGTYDGTTLRLFINGVQVGSSTGSFNIAGVTYPLRVGNSAASPDRGFPGRIDDVRIWNTAVSSADILAHMHTPYCSAQPGLVAYYKFDQGIANGNNPTVTTLNDISVNSNNGTLNGFALSGTTSNWVQGQTNMADCGAIACPSPAGVAITNLSATGFDLSWSDNGAAGYEYEVRASGAAGSGSAGLVASGTSASGTSPIAITGLSGNTNYLVHVRANCGGDGFSLWNNSSNILTPCSTPGFPYTEDFNAVTLPLIPTCMAIQTVTGPAWTTATAPAGMSGNAAYNYGVSTSSTNTSSWLYTEGLPLTAGMAYHLTYKYSNLFNSQTDALRVAYGISTQGSAMTNQLADYPLINDGLVHEAMVDFAPLTTGIYYIGFQRKSPTVNYGYYMFVDDISVTVAPVCPIPTAVSVSATTDNSTYVDFTCVGCTGNVIVEYGPSGFTPGTAGAAGTGGTLVSTSASSPQAVSGLSPNTSYDIYVRQDCSNSTNGYSGNSAVTNFLTLALDCEGVPGGSATIGTACNDGDPSTGNDIYDANCNCVGELIDCLNVPGGSATIGSSCDDGDANTGNDVYGSDCVCAGSLNDCLGVPGGNATIGSSCNDGNANTGNDVYGSDCVCVGQLNDCLGVPGGSATIGSSCDDGNANTGNDVYNANCNCVGQPLGTVDCEGVLNGPALPGTACDDGNASTISDTWSVNCTCSGTLVGPCTGNEVIVSINTDNNPGQITWDITNANHAVIASGGPTAVQTNTLVNETVCLSLAPESACYGFHLMDSFGDGISGGNWQLRSIGGRVLLSDDFANGNDSPTISPAPAYAGYTEHSFCLPLGNSHTAAKSCGIFNYTMNSKVYCNNAPGATSYQFEFSDPDAGFIRRIAVPTNWVRFNQMQTSPLTPGVKYFVRVRNNGSGAMASAHFGGGCEVGMSSTLLCTELISAPTYGHSCDESRAFNTNNSFIYALPVVGATEYQFRVYNLDEGYDETFIRSTYILQLKWNFGVAPPLANGSTYNVTVNVKVGTLYSGFCGNVCTITIDNPGRPEAGMAQTTGTTTIWPNPVRDDEVNLSIDGIQDADQNITVDIQDIYGKQLFAKEFGNSGEHFTTILDLPSDIASGVYMVNITVNGQKTVQRLSIIK